MSDFYQITLSQFSEDHGRSDKGRPLSKDFVGTGEERQKAAGDFFDVASRVIFDVSPTISETREAQYVNEPMPGPVGMVMYMLTGNRTFTIGARFVSRTVQEANTTYAATNVLRSWLLPQGQDGTDSKAGRPPILRLNGYKQQFFNIPVVLTNLSINFSEDVDYIEIEKIAMVPIIQTVDITVIESHRTSTARISKGGKISGVKERGGGYGQDEFNLADFKAGKLHGY